MSQWTHAEPGPTCFCGRDTYVNVSEDGEADLLCVFHAPFGGSVFPLPAERPERWPAMTNDEMKELVSAESKRRGD